MKIFQWIWFLVLAAVAPGFFAENVFGQEETPDPAQRAPLVSDRPSFTTDSTILPTGDIQLELGVTYREWNNGSDETSWEGPEALLRYGWKDRWELRLSWEGYSFRDLADEERASNIAVGYKHMFKAADETVPWDKAFAWIGEIFPWFNTVFPWLGNLDGTTMSTIFMLEIPTGHGPNDVETLTLIGWNHDLTDMDHLSGNMGFANTIDEDNGDRFFQGKFSFMYSRDVQDSFISSWFAEYYTNFPAADNEDAEHVVQTGFLYHIDDNWQFDARVGFGLNDQADDWLVGIGLTHRF